MGADRVAVVVKTFATTTRDDGQEEVTRFTYQSTMLPDALYDLEPASEKIDAWAFGTVLFNMLSASPLLPVNRDDDLLGPRELADMARLTQSAVDRKINGATIHKALLADGCILTDAHIERSVIGVRSIVEAGTTIRNNSAPVNICTSINNHYSAATGSSTAATAGARSSRSTNCTIT